MPLLACLAVAAWPSGSSPPEVEVRRGHACTPARQVVAERPARDTASSIAARHTLHISPAGRSWCCLPEHEAASERSWAPKRRARGSRTNKRHALPLSSTDPPPVLRTVSRLRLWCSRARAGRQSPTSPRDALARSRPEEVAASKGALGRQTATPPSLGLFAHGPASVVRANRRCWTTCGVGNRQAAVHCRAHLCLPLYRPTALTLPLAAAVRRCDTLRVRASAAGG